MRVFAVSDVHVDYSENQQWVAELSADDYREDLLVLAGDISDSLQLLEWCLETLAARFAQVLYVPGNHDLWVMRDNFPGTSLDKFQRILQIVQDCGVTSKPLHRQRLSIVPLLSWYDYSFGEPTHELQQAWVDFHACRWPQHLTMQEVAEYFLVFNHGFLDITNETVISFSHFMPRLDLMPSYIPARRRMLYPVLGSTRLETQIRRLKPAIHIYGHSHLNRNLTLDGVRYVNNAYGYPHEGHITAKRLECVYED